MCGIIGQAQRDVPVDPVRFDAMRDTLRHRGPDGSGTRLLRDGQLAFGHRRLSILDLTSEGAQPMTDAEETVWLTYNGEIYNYRSLRNELRAAGYAFRSTSDSEVLVHGYSAWGMPGLLHRLKGMFAFAVYDVARERIYLARDRFGIKPLLYYHDERQFLFASELKAITADPAVKRTLSHSALADYFIYSYVPTPNCIWREVQKLPPAHYAEYDARTHQLSVHRYWQPEAALRRIPPAEAVEKTEAILNRVVGDHLVSDVPVGVFLSGGYDSTCVLKAMRAAGESPSAFTLGFRGSEKSEHAAAAEIARVFGADHVVDMVDFEANLFEEIQRLGEFYDEPYGVTSQITYHQVAEMAARTHKVVLAGDGGDEVLAGYTWYHRLAGERNRPRVLAKHLLGRKNRRVHLLEQYDRGMTGVRRYLRHYPVLADQLATDVQRRGYAYFDRHFPRRGNFVKRVQHLDIHTYLLDNCLQRADTSSMMHSLEVRVPFLDHELFEFFYGLHPSVYHDPRQPKRLLRETLTPHLGPDILDRPKQGFGYQHYSAVLTSRFESYVNGGELRKLGWLAGKVDFKAINPEVGFHLVFLERWLRNNAV